MTQPHINKSALNIVKNSFSKIDTAEIYEWARTNISLPNAYADTGPFIVEKSRYLIEPFKALKDFNTRTVVINKAVQTGGSLLADIWIPWILCNRPAPIQFCQKTEQMTTQHLNNRLYKLIANCRPLKHMLPESDRDYTDSGMIFPSCTLYVGSAKESSFQAKSICYEICDEVHLWDRGRLPEALSRTSAFDRKGTSKQLVISQPGTVDDDFYGLYSQGTMEEWNVICEGCGKYFFPVFRKQRDDGTYCGLLWDTTEKTKVETKWIMPEVLKTVRYECEYCGHKHIYSKDLLEKWNRTGKYIQTNPQGTISVRSFRWNSLVKDDWCNLVTEFISAKDLADMGIKDNLTQFFQKRITRPYDPNMYNFVGHIKTDVYDVNINWPEEVARFATIDLQKMHFWLEVRAWSGTGASKQLFFGKVATDSEVKDILSKFNVQQNSIFVDIGNSEKNENTGRHEAFDYVARNGWTGLRGDWWADQKGGYEWNLRGGQVVKLFYSKPQPIPNNSSRWYYNFSPTPVRDIAKELRDGKSHEFKSLDNQDFKKQLFAEKKIPIRDKYGQVIWRWKNVNNLPNHSWDCVVMQVVATLIHPNIHVIPKAF